MPRSKATRLLAFTNIVVGGGIALVGLLLLLLWLIVGVSTSPRSPIFSRQEIPLMGTGFLFCFGLVALSGIGLWRGARWGFPAAVAACIAVAVGGAAMFEAHLSNLLFPPWFLKELVSLSLQMTYEEVHVLLLAYAVYPLPALLMLMSLGRRRFTTSVLVVWALLGVGFGIFLAIQHMGAILERSLSGYSPVMNAPSIRHLVADDTVWGLLLLQALTFIGAGCFAAIPLKKVRRVAWILYGLLIPGSLLLPVIEAAFGAWVGLPRNWSWTWPDFAFMGVGFGLCGLLLLAVSQWLCRDQPPVEPTADVEMELAT